VLERFDKPTADLIDWNAPRLICIAADFTKYDEHAVQQINRNIELIRYRIFGQDLLLLELVNAVSVKPNASVKTTTKSGRTGTGRDKTIAEWLEETPSLSHRLFESLEAFVSSLGDDVQRKDLSLYVAFKRIKNFVTVVFKKNGLYVYANINPQGIELKSGFTRDVTSIGHWGTGNLEITLNSEADFVLAKPLIVQAYEGGFHNR
jgi:predicted transport protein